MAGWGRGRAALLAFLTVVALAVALGQAPRGDDRGPAGAQGGIYAANLAIGPENATVRSLDEAGPRRWTDGRAGRPPLALVLAVLLAAAVVAAASRPVRSRRQRRRPPDWLGAGSLAPRAPPFVLRPL